jgi:hypothetical protein
MKLSSAFYVAATYACGFLVPVVVSELKMQVLLNNGVLPTKEGYTCTPNDTLLMKSALAYLDEDDRRSLKTKAKCKEECVGQAAGSCIITGCKGFRRQLRVSANRKMYDDDVECEEGISMLEKSLDALIPKLSAPCRPVVQSKRQVTCFDDVRYAQVLGFSMWNADTDTVVATNFTSGMTFCYTSRRLNIEAIVNACVREVDMRLSGPVSESEDSRDTAPYTIFGFDDDNRQNLYGRVLKVGKYTISSELEDSYTPKASATFTVKQC